MTGISNGVQPVGDRIGKIRTTGGTRIVSDAELYGGITPDEVDSRGKVKSEISDKLVETAIQRVRNSGVLDHLETWRREDGYDPIRGGRPSAITAESVVVAFLLLAGLGESLLIREVAKLLHHRISDDMRTRLGLAQPAPWFISKHAAALRWEENVRSTFRRHILDVMDPFPTSRHESMSMLEVQQALLAHDPVNAEIKKARLDEFMNCFVQMTYREQPRDIRRAGRKMDLTIDQTFLAPPTKKGYSRNRLEDDIATELRALQNGRALTPDPVDPYAGWYPKTGDRPDLQPSRGTVDLTSPSNPGSGQGLEWGWTLNLAARVDASMPDESAFPRIIAAATLSLPNIGVSEEAITLMRSALGDDNIPGVVDADKAYFANALPERLHYPTRELGYMPSTDYRIDRIGQPRTNVKGALFVDGRLYCPSTPTHLLTAVADVRSGAIDDTTFSIRRDERKHFQVRVKQKADTNGTARVQCPARGISPTVTCPIVEMHKNATRNKVRPGVEDAPAFLDEICQKAHGITVDTRELVRDEQAFEYGSPEWEAFHGHARNLIESTNAQMKAAIDTDLSEASRRPARGFAAAAFFSTILITAFNIAKIAAFLHDRRQRQIEGPVDRDKPLVGRRRDTMFYNPYTGTVPFGLRDPEYIERRKAELEERKLKKRTARAKKSDGALPTHT